MKFRSIHIILCALCGACGPALADRVELHDGSVVHGRLVSAEAGKFKFETEFAGVIEIAQDKIRAFTTEEAVNVSLSAGSTLLGRVEKSDDGIRIVAADGRMNAEPANVSAVWRPGVDGPEVRRLKEEADKMRRKWAYEASVALTGRTGVSEKFGANLGFKATLQGPGDKLVFSLAAERATDKGVDTADRQFGSVDYSSFFAERGVWYVRTSIEKDKIKALDLRSTSAFGVGRKLIKRDIQDLEARLGVSYLFETYSDESQFESPGGDLALIHSYKFSNARLANSVVYTPAFEDFGNYRIRHESSFEVPISASKWKLRLGLANEYQSKPAPGADRLDTTYFTSLILNWN